MASEFTVLVVDDDDMIRSVVRISLQKVNEWTVLEAANGADGVAIAGADHPDVILLDFQMPKMNGADTLKCLREDPATASTSVIFLTAKTGRKARNEYLKMGAIGTTEKPFEPLSLGQQIVGMIADAKGA
jgi:CheY-like chemotaxis protein